MHEFELIERYFKPLTEGRAEALSLADDAAVLGVPAGEKLVVSSDTLNEDVHFLAGCDPAALAKKALRVNLSDLTAMGAKPYSYQLCMTYADAPDEAWLAAFTSALLEDQIEAGIFCSGGDTTRGAVLSITMTVMGLAAKPVMRTGAQARDVLIVTGALGLAEAAFKAGEVYVPPLRCNLVDIIQKYAKACVDISDGLYQDVGHMGIDVDYVSSGFSSFGEDYELAIAVDLSCADEALAALEAQGCAPFIAGHFVEAGQGTKLEDAGGGYKHF